MGAENAEMKELLELVARALVDRPDDVLVTEVEGEQTTVLELKVDREDLGKVIGRRGRTARAMRTILNCSTVKNGRKAVLEIVE